MTFLDELDRQRWDDHRYYHRSRVNQTLHLMSACCFLASYALLFVNPVAAVMVGWLLAMVLRQIGHFVFEPRGYDEVNTATHEYKERVKVGYNLRRKAVLLSLWGAVPLALYLYPSLSRLFGEAQAARGLLHDTAVSWLWLGAGAVLFRTVHLFFLMGVRSGLVWLAKILTDPLHDIRIYHKAPYRLWKGETRDGMTEWYRPALATQQAQR